ncbi:hypothetical protein NDU88_005884 [Pleurodeles waltl]|uniref:Uncharacterized protein n=1 Tax=Pleurodeles waltl TaxID=8319 RepID=A0AAV7SN47_PLEWA|nr:hypothetical protein NDU88_005884 [Pleurodeles waltl]
MVARAAPREQEELLKDALSRTVKTPRVRRETVERLALRDREPKIGEERQPFALGGSTARCLAAEVMSLCCFLALGLGTACIGADNVYTLAWRAVFDKYPLHPPRFHPQPSVCSCE